MNRTKRKRITLRNRQRVVLLSIVLSGAASTVVAGTHENPFFKAARPAKSSVSESAVVPQSHDGVTESFAQLPSVEAAATNPADSIAARSNAIPRRLPRVHRPSVAPEAIRQDSPVIASAAQRDSMRPSEESSIGDSVSTHWLQSITSESCISRASGFLDDAYREYSVGAWSSAEASAWKSLELTATGIDVEARQLSSDVASPTASKSIRIARTAIHEARDFIASGAAVDDELIFGIASSHETPILAAEHPISLTPTEAADRYLDYARVMLAPLAARHVQAAQAMDLIAAIQLGRNEAKWLPEETSLCLRRAALQGQPSNASLAARLGMQLADMGLDAEAQWTLRHAMSLAPTRDVAVSLEQVTLRCNNSGGGVQISERFRGPESSQPSRPRVPDVIQLSPAQFASISPAVNTMVQPSTVVPSSGEAKPTVPIAAAAAAAEPAPKRTSRVLPASLAGFRLPFAKSETAKATFDPVGIESTVDDIYAADEFQTYADSASDQDGATDSPVKRFFGKIPKLW